MVLPDSGRITRVRPYLGTLWNFTLFSPTGLSPSMVGLSRRIWLIGEKFVLRSCNPLSRRIRFGLFPVRSPLLRESRLIYFPQPLRCFSSLGVLYILNYSVYIFPTLLGMGFPIRKSLGQSLLSGSPKLIAASYVLHRSLESRHSLFAHK